MENHGQEPRPDTSLAPIIALSRAAILKRWLLRLEPVELGPPNDLTFAEIAEALTQIEKRVAECRKIYPWSPPVNTTDAVIRSMPPHLRAGSKQDTARVVMPATDISA